MGRAGRLATRGCVPRPAARASTAAAEFIGYARHQRGMGNVEMEQPRCRAKASFRSAIACASASRGDREMTISRGGYRWQRST